MSSNFSPMHQENPQTEIPGRTIAIGDIHGCNKTFRSLLFDTLKITKLDTVICLGDYINRGPDSKGVVDTILELRMNNHTIITLRGNHEECLIQSDHDDTAWEFVEDYGQETLRSFGIENYSDLPDVYQQFFEKTSLFHVTSSAIFVHGGINLNMKNPFKNPTYLLWERKSKFNTHNLQGRIIVHGHSPISREELLATKGPVYNLDTGCVFHSYRHEGYLSAMNIETRQMYSLLNCES